MRLIQSGGSISDPTWWHNIVLGNWTLNLRFYIKNVGLLHYVLIYYYNQCIVCTYVFQKYKNHNIILVE